MQYSQEHLKTMVYAKFGGQTECVMGNSKIENGGRGPQMGEVTCGRSPHLSNYNERLYRQAGYLTYLGSPSSM